MTRASRAGYVRYQMNWLSHVFSVELRKALAYRADFWVQVLASVLSELVVAYFLWKAVFDHNGVTEMGGYTFGAMMLYYLLANMTMKVLTGPEYGFISTEIYEGSLTRYLVFPIPYSAYKFAAYFAKSSVALFQMVVVLIVFVILFGLPEGVQLAPSTMMMGLIAASLSTLLYFAMAAILEMVAFWADNVWSLMVMLRFSTQILGGGLLPLTLFPDWSQGLMAWLPFHFLTSFPVRTMMGQLSLGEWAAGIAGTLAWVGVFFGVGSLIWRRGTYQYSGVGV